MSYTKVMIRRPYIYYGNGGMYPDIPPYKETKTEVWYRPTDCGGSAVGEYLPNWRHIRARGNCATTSFSAQKTERFWEGSEAYLYESFRYDSNASKPDAYRWARGDFIGLNSITIGAGPSPSSALLSRAAQRFISKYNNTVHSFQGGVWLGELAETIHMLRNPAMALRRGIDAWGESAKRIARGKMPRKTKNRALRDSWLEWNYGWAPAIGDISSASKALNDLPIDTWTFISAFEKDKSLVSDDGGIINSLNGTPYRKRQLSTTECSVKWYGVVNTSRGNFYTELERWGFDPSSWLPTVWELIPYSFLVDYFTNIGKMIEAASTNFTRLKWASRSWRSTAEMRIYVHGAPGYSKANLGSSWRSYVCTTSCAVIKKSQVVREISPTLSMPSFQFRLPGTSTRWINIAALLRLRK